MTKIDRSTYGGLSNKKSKGTPNQYWVERFIDRTVIHVYPTPDSTNAAKHVHIYYCLLYTSPSPRDRTRSRMPSSA